jgi:hypothetical protein
MKTLLPLTSRGLLACAIVAAVASPALAGPPLVCFPFDIGTARSLPWAADAGWKGMRPDYDVTKLTSDTTSLLSGSAPIVVRMETLRRAALYATRDATVAKALLDQLNQRAVETKGNGRSRALALFDAGYLIEVYKQIGPISAQTGRLAAALDGYAMVRQSLALSENDPAIEFAAALMTGEGHASAVHAEHVRHAREGSAKDVLLARNVSTHLER